MQNVLVDDRRIWVDFSQSVAKANTHWSNEPKRAARTDRSGGFGGRDDLVRTSKYRESKEDRGAGGYGMVFDVPSSGGRRRSRSPKRRRSRSPREHRDRDRDRRRRD